MIGIKNFEMPSNCLSCPLCMGSFSFDSKYCAITKTLNACNGIERAYNCPLTEIEEPKTEVLDKLKAEKESLEYLSIGADIEALEYLNEVEEYGSKNNND